MKGCCQSQCANCHTKTPKNVIDTISVALVGNPNCGKTTVFNALTGSKQRVGNWPGVTVERKSGYFTHLMSTIEVIDLPGIYSLNLATEAAIDERIACDYILKGEADVVINILDASSLERHLYLTMQLLEMGAPLIIALNMMDVATARDIDIDVNHLSKLLGCPVVKLEANKTKGIDELKSLLACFHASKKQMQLTYPKDLQTAINQLQTSFTQYPQRIRADKQNHQWLAVRLLENDKYALNLVDHVIKACIPKMQATIKQTCGEDADILFAEARYQQINNLLTKAVRRSTQIKTTWTTYIDHIVLNRVLGIPIFLVVMYCLFFFAINIGGAFQDFFDISSRTIFVDGFAYWLQSLGSPLWLTALLANGIGKGINTVVTFIPVIGAMFLFLALLEDSGYMARAAFVIDRFMRVLGLPGKAFVPMIVGFGCNVPAVMAARTLENKRDRILTILMSPFMSCGARLAIFAVFTAAFFPMGGQNVVFGLYLIGIAMAILTGFILRKTLLKGDPAPLVMELPAYHVPRIRTLIMHAWQRLKNFVIRAGKLIIPICILIGALNTLNMDGTLNSGEGDQHSLLSVLGQWLTPFFSPMGLRADNWPATVGLVTGVLAKEVVIGTLNTLYAQLGHFAVSNVSAFNLWAGLQEAWNSIPANFAELKHALVNPVLAKAPIDAGDQSVYGLMYQKFDGQIGAFAYLLFVLLYFPCISTTAAMMRELHRGWSIFSVVWMGEVAYIVSVIFYQLATWSRHPWSSSLWVVGMSSLFFGTIALVHWVSGFEIRKRNKHILLGESA